LNFNLPVSPLAISWASPPVWTRSGALMWTLPLASVCVSRIGAVVPSPPVAIQVNDAPFLRATLVGQLTDFTAPPVADATIVFTELSAFPVSIPQPDPAHTLAEQPAQSTATTLTRRAT
jgi:hypothetical protein